MNPLASTIISRAGRSAAALGLLLLLLASAACRRPGADDAGDDEAGPVRPVEVRTAVARTAALHPSIELVGRLTAIPEKTTRVAARVAGTVVEVAAVDGRRVEEGDVVVRLDATLLAAESARLRAVVAERTALGKRLEKGARPEEIAVAAATLRRAEVVAQGAASRLAALERLAASAEVSPVRLDEARTQAASADADAATARAALRLLEAGTRPERIAEARASLAAASADLAAAEARERFAVVKAPHAGTVTDLSVRVGEGVSAADVLMEIADLATLFLRVRIPAAVVSRVAVGTTCEVRFETTGDAPVEGRVDRFGGVADPSTGGVWGYLSVADRSGLLRPGMTGRATLPLGSLPATVAVPVACVGQRGGTAVVTVIRDGAAHEIEVTTGTRAEGLVQILSGVADGDRVATWGGYGLPDGQPVTVVSESAGG